MVVFVCVCIIYIVYVNMMYVDLCCAGCRAIVMICYDVLFVLIMLLVWALCNFMLLCDVFVFVIDCGRVGVTMFVCNCDYIGIMRMCVCVWFVVCCCCCVLAVFVLRGIVLICVSHPQLCGGM